jgi:hypothetical protein
MIPLETLFETLDVDYILGIFKLALSQLIWNNILKSGLNFCFNISKGAKGEKCNA